MGSRWLKRLLCFCALAIDVCAQADLRGIYIYTNDVSGLSKTSAAQLTRSLSVPGIDGVAIVIGWDAIEPAMGQYQWAVLDQWIGQSVALGKKIDLVVPAGSSTPSWLFAAPPAGPGVNELTFTVSPHSGETGVCDSVNIAAPWDPGFLAQGDAMLTALSAHLKSANTYDVINLLRITGINRTTEELRLPAETAQSTGLACVSDSITTWKQAGYLPSLLLQGWNALLGSFLKNFPDKSFAVSIIPNDAFPGIDQNGRSIAGTIGDENDPLIMAASKQLSGRLVVQFDFLMPSDAAAQQVVDDANNFGTLMAFQTNEYLGLQGAGCAEPITVTVPCTDGTFLQMLERGVYPRTTSSPLRSQYVEVFYANAIVFPDDILTAHLQLLPPAISAVANAEGGSPIIAPNTWVALRGAGLALTGDTRVWQASDLVNNQLPTQLDQISVTVNNKAAFVYYISPTQINILTPPDAISGQVPVQISNNGAVSATFMAQAQALSPSFFEFPGRYVAAVHASGALIGPAALYPGSTTPAKPGEVIVVFANGFGNASAPVVSGSENQSGILSPLPVVKIGGVTATVSFAGLVFPGEYQFNVQVPTGLADGDQEITASYGGQSTPTGTLITLHQ
jgi:uncharacterized protein (TIGR03437 family)